MIAHLGMYDMPAIAAANDAYWLAIRAAMGFGPETLSRDQDYWPIWRNTDLLFSQTCGYPYRAALHEKVQLIGTPDYGLSGCPPGYYQSLIVARHDGPFEQMQGAVLAYNEPLSQSGWAGPVAHLTAHSVMPGAGIETGAHAASATAVVEGRADFAGIDALTFALLKEHAPEQVAGLHVIARTAPTPALPYITSLTQDAGQLSKAVSAAIDTLAPQHKNALHLKGLVQIPADAYLRVTTPPPPEAVFQQTLAGATR